MEVGGGTKHERLLQDKPNSIVLVALYDDGYGSSNSSPHSTVFHIQNCSPNQGKGCKGVKQESNSNQEVTQPTNTPPMEKKELEAGLVGETVVCRTLSVTTVTKETEGKFIGDDGRETWRSNADFLLSIIGFAVDLANVWRFPYLCYRNGGGAFLVPYTLMLVFGAMPLFYMELALGQYNRQGPVSVWKICPIFKGVGMCAVVVAFIVSFYYNVIIAWALYYLVDSFSYTLPWVNCNNTWNSKSCQVTGIHISSFLNGTDGNSSITQQMLDANFSSTENSTGPLSDYSPASEYFNREVLGMQYSEGLQDFGTPKWQMVICIFIVYCMLYLSLFKGVKSSGKVVWVTAIMPYVVLAILLVRGLMLPGAVSGIKYYLKPELSKLKETQVWLDAAVQIFFSVGAGFGVHLSYASYNNFHNNCLMDCIITTAVNSFTSFFSGFVIFTYLGFMSHKAGIPISSVATEGAGLVFQVYPEAVATLPGSQFWSILFFFMLIMLGLDSGMGGLECVITGLMDEFKNIFKEKWISREKFTLIIVFTSFCVATLNAAPGGIYMFHLLDTYAAGVSLLCSAFFEAIAVSWFYGIERLCKDIEEMLGFQPGLFFRICWKFISPLFIFFVVFFGLLNHEPLKYGDYNYPVWAECVGWAVSLASILMIPGLAILQIIKTPGSFRDRIAYSITPIEEHAKMRETKEVTRFKCKHWLYI